MKIGSVAHFTKIHDNLMAKGKYDDLVTRILNELLTKQDHMIETLVKKLKELT